MGAANTLGATLKVVVDSAGREIYRLRSKNLRWLNIALAQLSADGAWTDGDAVEYSMQKGQPYQVRRPGRAFINRQAPPSERSIAAKIFGDPRQAAEWEQRAAMNTGGPLALLVPLAKWVTRNRPALKYDFRFDELSVYDVKLAKRYPGLGLKMPPEVGEDCPDWQSVTQAFPLSGDKTKNKVPNMIRLAMQPRIAEILFGRLPDAVIGCDSGAPRRDLNLEALAGGTSLPTEDWEVGPDRVDVKCNLYLRSQRETVGLRGFVIEIDREIKQGSRLAGFVFHASSDEAASALFVGLLRPDAVPQEASPKQGPERVAPFFFALPDDAEFRFLEPKPPPADPRLKALFEWATGVKCRNLLLARPLAFRQPLRTAVGRMRWLPSRLCRHTRKSKRAVSRMRQLSA